MRTYNLSKIMSDAHRICKITREIFAACLRKAWMLAKLAVEMHKRVVRFYYIKKSTGELREAFGTLLAERIAPTKGTDVKRGSDIFTYYDTEKEQYRCFKTYNIVRVTL